MCGDVGEDAALGQSVAWVAVAGPSGAGKDTLLEAVRAGLLGDPRFHFARRSITRPATPGGEAHEPLTSAAFQAALAAGDFLLHWRAHGLAYGIRATEAPAGQVVILSLSRAILREAACLRPLRVIEVTAPPELLARRLAGRGREDAANVAARLAREVPLPAGLDVVRVSNDASIAEGAARLRAVLEGAAAACLPGGFRP